MANQKITELNQLFPYSASINDLTVVVDVDDFSSPTGETKKMTLGDLGTSVLNFAVSGSPDYFLKVDDDGSGIKLVESIETIQLNIHQTTHSFQIGDAVRKTTTSSLWSIATSDSDDNAEALGIVSKLSGSDDFVLVTRGLINTVSGLSEGDVYFLATASTGIAPFRNTSLTEPDFPDISKPMYVAISTSSAIVLNYRGSAISGTGGSGGSGSSAGVSETVSQTSHGLLLGDVVRRTSGSWVTASSDTDINAEALGVVSVVTNVNVFTVIYEGIIDTLSGLSDSEVYFLATASTGIAPFRNITLSQPVAPFISKPIYIATSPTTAVIVSYRGAVITTGSAELSGSALFISGSQTSRFVGDVVITGSLTITSSATFHNIGPTILEGPTTCSILSASLFIGDGSGLSGIIASSGSVETASYVENAQSASLWLQTGSFVNGVVGVNEVSGAISASVVIPINIGGVTYYIEAFAAHT